jgi:hypothetical protein
MELPTATRRRVARRDDFVLEDVRTALPDVPTFRTGAVAQRLEHDYDLTTSARQLLGKYLRRHGEVLGIRWTGPVLSNVTVPAEKGTRWERIER